MRTLFNENSKKGSELLRDAEAYTYMGLSRGNTGSGFLNPLSLPFAIASVGSDAVGAVADTAEFFIGTIGEAFDVEDWVYDFIKELPQYSFETDLSYRKWDPIFNPHPELGLKSSGVASVFWTALLAGKFGPKAMKGMINLTSFVRTRLANRRVKAWRNGVSDGIEELISRNELSNFDSRLSRLEGSIDLLVSLSKGLYSNNTSTKREFGEAIDQFEATYNT